jgi:hypothetical protein
MEMVVGYKLVGVLGDVYQTWGGIWGQCPAVPNPVELPNGEIVYSMEIEVYYSGYKLIEWRMQEPPPPVPQSISRRQAATQLRNDQYISQNEALAMASVAAIPPFVSGYFDTLDPVDKENAQLAFTAIDYPRDSSLLIAVMTANGLSDDQINQFFISASKL